MSLCYRKIGLKASNLGPRSLVCEAEGEIRWLFLESLGNFSGRKAVIVFVVFAFKIKVSIILKIIKQNYQLMKQNWLVCGPLTVLLFNRFGFQNLPLGPTSCRAFRKTLKTGPRSPFETLIFIWMQTQAQNIFLGPKSFRDFRETGTRLHVSNVTGDECFLTASLDFNGNSISL